MSMLIDQNEIYSEISIDNNTFFMLVILKILIEYEFQKLNAIKS